jgi:hypothetical protein
MSLSGGKAGAVGLRAGQDVVLVDGVEPVRDQPAVLGDDGVGTDLVVGRVQVGNARGDLQARRVRPAGIEAAGWPVRLKGRA